MKIKTSELTGAALDWAVWKCAGGAAAHPRTASGKAFLKLWKGNSAKYVHPSTDRSQGGPIIKREKLLPCYAPDGGDDPGQPWVCDDYAGQVPSGVYWGETMLIAAMRCYVASKLGDEVDVPEELT